MQIVAYQKNIRTTARKMRLVADSVRKMSPIDSLDYLKFMHKRAAEVLAKVVKQAIANAKDAHNIEPKNLIFKHLLIEEGPTFKRFRSASRGRARMILKRSSHIKVVLEEKTKVQNSKSK